MKTLKRISGSILALACMAQAADLLVPEDYPTIQSAINAAAAGDFVKVGPGLYTENLELHNLDIQLVSIAGPEATIIDGGNTGSVLDIHGPSVTNACLVEGFTFRNGRGDPHIVSGVLRGGVGGGILCRDGSDPVIRNNRVINNLAAAPQGIGGGILAWSCTPVIENNVIESNASHYGGGVYLLSSDAVLRNNLIRGNTTQSGGKGGGVRVLYGDPLVEGNTIVENYAHWIGSAIAVSEWGSNPVIRRNLIVGNLHSAPLDYAFTSDVPTGCNLLWENEGGNSWPTSEYLLNLGGNIIANPLLCPDSWYLDQGSPALPGNHPSGSDCDLIGAFGQGCGQVAGSEDRVLDFMLRAPWPNPFNPVTHISISMATTSDCSLEIYTVSGGKIATLHDGLLARGEHTFEFDGSGLSSGLYFAVFRSEGTQLQQKLTLLK